MKSALHVTDSGDTVQVMLDVWALASQTLEYCLRTTDNNYVRDDIERDFLEDWHHHCGPTCDCQPCRLYYNRLPLLETCVDN